MLREEFSERTGFYPSSGFYAVIEKVYMDSDDDKDTFCDKYKENKDGFAERIQYLADLSDAEDARRHLEHCQDLEQKMQILEERLDEELEWKPYFSSQEYSKENYANLKASTSVKELSDNDVKRIINREIGFDKDLIVVLRSRPICVVNRHGQIRSTKESDFMPPLYGATDWNYIRFSVRGQTYEYQDGDLRSV